jgi:hypothetical protein
MHNSFWKSLQITSARLVRLDIPKLWTACVLQLFSWDHTKTVTACRQLQESSPFCGGGKVIKVLKLISVTSFFPIEVLNSGKRLNYPHCFRTCLVLIKHAMSLQCNLGRKVN